MKISEVLAEAPLDTPLDPVGTAVGRGTGKAGYGVGYAAGKLASKFQSKKDNNVTDKERNPDVFKAIGQGIKQGTKQHFGVRDKNYAEKNWSVVIDQVVDGDQVNRDELNTLIRELPSMKLSWRIDRNAVASGLNKYSKGESLDGVELNALKKLSSELKEI
jgi:hypothetical protein